MERHNDNLRILGLSLRADRRELHMSARDTASQAGISPVYLLTLEKTLNRKTGKPTQPSPHVLISLAETLKTDPSKYLSLAGFGPDLSPMHEVDTGANILSYAGSELLSLSRLSQTETVAHLRSVADRVEVGQFASGDLPTFSGNLTTFIDRNLQKSEAYKEAAEEIELVKQRLISRLNGLEGEV